MTLALVLAVPDGRSIRGTSEYRRCTLENPVFLPVRQGVERGRSLGVFAPQLHGLEHYWPEALMGSADPGVRDWREQDMPASTEDLPAHLQSRWVDASVLPSKPLPRSAVRDAVVEEVRLYAALIGEGPRVVVPPTFVWTQSVETMWAEEGIELIVTPGTRYACRDCAGTPACGSGTILNGQMSEGIMYLVRNDYFEPDRGHRAEQGLDALRARWEQRRPCLLETHRSNFIGSSEMASAAFAELDRLLATALVQRPDLRFLSTEELGGAFKRRDPEWIATDLPRRLCAWVRRVRLVPGFSRPARWLGLLPVLELSAKVAGVVARPNDA